MTSKNNTLVQDSLLLQEKEYILAAFKELSYPAHQVKIPFLIFEIFLRDQFPKYSYQICQGPNVWKTSQTCGIKIELTNGFHDNQKPITMLEYLYNWIISS